MTITEALAEIKTVTKRIQSKREFVNQYLLRVDSLKDPFEKDGGSEKQIAQELQAIEDLEQRVVDLRHAIQYANENTALTIEGVERTIADWIIWRREISASKQSFLTRLSSNINSAREQVRRQGVAKDQAPLDITINLSEKTLSNDLEKLKNILGQLDGQLSLKNATVMVAI